MRSFAIRLGSVCVGAAAACSALALPAGGAAPATSPFRTTVERPDIRPNIVFVLADDLGWADVNTGRTNMGWGTPYTETPTIARLAEEGVAFDNAYASPMCVPTRANLLTGLYGPRPTNNLYQVGDLEAGVEGDDDGDDGAVSTELLKGPAQGLPDGDDALPGEAYTVAEALRDSGYATANIGKFHVTVTDDQIVNDFGFQENWGGSNTAHTPRYHAANGKFGNSISPSLDTFAGDYTQAYVDKNIKPFSHGVPDAAIDALVGTDKHVTDALADAAIDFIDRKDDQPFLAWISDFAVHTPVGDEQARADLRAKYQAKPAIRDHPARAGYSALVEGLDQGLARVLDRLEVTPDPRNPGHPLADNTVVVFTSDNGARKIGDRGPLSGQKGEVLEGGIRVPAVVWSRNPNLVDGGTINSTPIHAIDYFPTLASVTGATVPKGLRLDGVDLSGIWSNSHAQLAARPLFWHLPGHKLGGGDKQHPASVIRSGPWKLIYNYETRDWDLYNLETDIAEATDVSEQHPDVTGRLGSQLLRWLAEVEAPLATIREGKDPLAVTFHGAAYVNGNITRYEEPTQLIYRPGDEFPAFLPARFTN